MIAVLYVALGVFFDWKFFKIPNVLCLAMAMTGIFFSYLENGPVGLGISIKWMCLPIIVLYLLFYCGGLGAGDIKFFAALGTFFKKDIWKVIVLSFLINGLLACIRMKRECSFFVRLQYMKGYIRDCYLDGKLRTDYESRAVDRIHFSFGIFLAVLMMKISNIV